MSRKRKSGFIKRLKRVARYRLHIPIMRSRQPAHYVARGVMVGMFWAMTPFFGLHMALVFITWLFTRRLFKWDFSLVNGLAWTWTTNFLTILPAFYLFYLTGQILLGSISDPLGYDAFKSVFVSAEQGATDDPASTGWHLSNLWTAFGAPLFLGSALWSVFTAWASYHLALGFVIRYREHRARKMAAARKKPAPAKKRRASSGKRHVTVNS